MNPGDQEAMMFVQVFQGQVDDAEQVRDLMRRWVTDLAPGAVGWLGSTTGVTDEGTLIALARFESADAAQGNSDRPEQGAWWEQMATHFTAEPVFHNSTTVDVDTYGDPATAGFVQVMQGRTSDPDRVRELMTSNPTDWKEFRPEVLGTLNAGHEDGEWTMAIYFTTEQAAREGEQKEPPAEMQAMMAELESLSVGEPTFFDLRDPWLDGPA